MSSSSYLKLAHLPEKDGFTESISDFGLRILTSRLPNLFPRSGVIMKEAFIPRAKILVAGQPEGLVKIVWVTGDQRSPEIGVGIDEFTLKGAGLEGGYDGCSHRRWVETSPIRRPEILGHTTRLLGELGLYSGIAV